MKFGYMAGFRSDLLSEIRFAKKYFNFIEITIQPELFKNFDSIFNDIEKELKDFEVLGHIHWEATDINDIKKNIDFLKKLNAKKATLHPFENLSLDENAEMFNKINSFFKEGNMQLLIENVTREPYNLSDTIKNLLDKIPDAKLTLDIGHANKSSELEKFIDSLGSKIGHIHMHDNIGQADHLFFDNADKLKNIISKIKSFGYDDTILMETFSIMKNNKNESQEFEPIKEQHIKQLEIINNGISN